MKKKFVCLLIINYLVISISLLIVIINNISFIDFIGNFLVLIISINSILLIFNYLYVNISKTENKSHNDIETESKSNIDIAIPPIESELKDILKDMKEDDEKVEDEFKELNFKDLND